MEGIPKGEPNGGKGSTLGHSGPNSWNRYNMANAKYNITNEKYHITNAKYNITNEKYNMTNAKNPHYE